MQRTSSSIFWVESLGSTSINYFGKSIQSCDVSEPVDYDKASVTGIPLELEAIIIAPLMGRTQDKDDP